ncbi:MAG: hypothetical protein KF716_07355 [Anaerolineae bacterium]|nr:hypothetical protein [Anaerolineae bacterium]
MVRFIRDSRHRRQHDGDTDLRLMPPEMEANAPIPELGLPLFLATTVSDDGGAASGEVPELPESSVLIPTAPPTVEPVPPSPTPESPAPIVPELVASSVTIPPAPSQPMSSAPLEASITMQPSEPSAVVTEIEQIESTAATLPFASAAPETAMSEGSSGETAPTPEASTDAVAEPVDSQAPIETPSSPTGLLETVSASAPTAAASGAPAARSAAPSAGAPSEDPNGGRAALSRWQGSVRRAGGAVPTPTLGEAGATYTRIRETGAGAASAQRTLRASVAADAASVIPAQPEVEAPPAPPASNPVPTHTQAIIEASDHRLPDQTPPPLVRRTDTSPLPTLGTSPISPQLFQVLVTPGALDLAAIPTDQTDSERHQLEQALDILNRPIEPVAEVGSGEPVPLVDSGPTRPVPIPEGLRTPVGQVIARLLAQPDEATRDVMRRLKTAAYPNAVLTAPDYESIGGTLQPTLQTDMVGELRDVATAAGLSAEELDTAILQRREHLAAEAEGVSRATTEAATSSSSEVSAAGQETLDSIAGARQSADEEIIHRQEQASGGSDPEVINARRDLTIRWIRDRVTTQTTNYQLAGERRDRELTTGQQQQEDAYSVAAQREEYQLLRNRPPAASPISATSTEEERRAHDAAAAREREVQDTAATIRAWSQERIETVRTAFRPMKRTASETTTQYRNTVQTAGDAALAAVRTWAEDRINEGRSWWDRLVTRLRRWLGLAQQETEHWEVRRTAETRDSIVRDLTTLNEIESAVRSGATQAELLETEGLTEDQRAIILAYFEGGGPSTDPLEIIARRLRATVANNHRARAVAQFEQDLLALGNADWRKLDNVGKAQRGSFDADRIATAVHAAIDQIGTDEAAIYSNLAGLNTIQIAAVRKRYAAEWGDLDEDLRGDLSEEELDRAQALMRGDQAAADAIALHDAIAGPGTDEDMIYGVLRNKTPEEREAIEAYYLRTYGESLHDALAGDMENNELDRADALRTGDTATADAIALDQAMRDGFLGTGWGTSEEDIQATFARVRDEVRAQAEREGWNTAQMEAEIRRRTRAIEDRFNTRYATVAEYNVPGLEGGSVLRRAFTSELSGGELALANALADNDLVRADAARLRIERESTIYADDDRINAVLRSQYERTLEETRRDEGPARRMIIERRIREELRNNPTMNAEDLSYLRTRLEREMDRTFEREAQERSHIAMDALDVAYREGSGGESLREMVESSTSFAEGRRAGILLDQGGYLSPLQEIEFATERAGTDEDALRRAVTGRTRAEIQQIREEWERRHPGEDFNEFLRGELSGRDEFDIMETVEHGTPESAAERIDSMRRRTDYELNEGGLLSGLAAGSEQTWLRSEMEALEARRTELYRPTPDTEEGRAARARLLEDVNSRADAVERGVEDTRRAVDSVTDSVTTVVGMTVGIVVGAALTFFSGGALGPVAIALISSLASTLATMGTRRLLQGDAYGIEAAGVDLATGLADAVMAVATAGMGNALLRGATAARTVRPTLVTRGLSRLGTRLGRLPGISRLTGSSGWRALGRGASALNRMEEGFLSSSIRSGSGRFGRAISSAAAPLRSLAESNRVMAEILAEGIENAVQSAPSAFLGAGLDDANWSGNVVGNIFSTGGMGTLQAAGMGMGFSGMGHLRGHLGMRLRTATPEGRFREGSRMMGDAYQQHRTTHPDASYGDFLRSPEGVRAAAEVQRRGFGAVAFEGDPRLRADAPDVAAAPHTGEPDMRTRPSVDGDTPTTARPTEADTPLPRQADPRAEALRNALPEGMRERIGVTVVPDDPDLPGRTVRVEYDHAGGLVTNVRIVAGPEATAIDIMMHAHVVQGLERYAGMLGRVRSLVERFDAWFHMEGHAAPGTTAFNARFEVEKLPGVIEQRIASLSRGDLDPAEQAHLLADIDNLAHQIDAHQRALDVHDTSEGEGFIAAQGKIRGVAGVDQRPGRTSATEMASHPREVAHGSPLEQEYGVVYQVGRTWQEDGRVYRLVEAVDAEGRVAAVREEIQRIDSNGRRIPDSWVQRGSESSRGGRIGEAASTEQISATHPHDISLPTQNASGQGFDSARVRMNPDGSATIVVAEVKNYPGRYVPFSDFTAIGVNLRQNMTDLRATLAAHKGNPAALGMTQAQYDAAVNAAKNNRIEIEVHTTPGTLIGSPTRGTVLSDLATDAQTALGRKGITVTRVPIDPAHMATAAQKINAIDRIGLPSARLMTLAGDTTTSGIGPPTPQQMAEARTILGAEGIVTNGLVTRTGPGTFRDASGHIFHALSPGASGGMPSTSQLATDILTRLRTPVPGAVNPTRVVVDTSNMSAADLAQLRNRLSLEPDAATLLPRLFGYDHRTGETNRLVP